MRSPARPLHVMSAWKRVALEMLPEYRDTIEAAENPMALWIEFELEFEEVYRAAPVDDDLIRRFYDYARWCIQSPGENGHLSDAGTAVVCAFYEHLPQHAAIRRDLHRWLTLDEFNKLRETFRYHLSVQEFADFEREFSAAMKKGARK